MIQPRSLVPARDKFSRPTPFQIVQRIAGMAFNFSTIQLPASTSETPEIAPLRDAFRTTSRTRRVPHELPNQQHTVLE